MGVRPGAGAGAAGVGLRPGVGVGGPESGVGVRPGVGAGAAGVGVRPGVGVGAPGTRYRPADDYAAHAAAFRADPGRYGAYDAARWAAYPGAWNPTRVVSNSFYTNPGYGALAAGLGMAAVAAPHDYGGNVVVQPNAVYVNGDPAGTPQEYAAQAGQIASQGQAEPPAETQWQPIGVFAAVQGDATDSDDVFQLAVSPQGTIRGNYHNRKSDEALPMTGSVDVKTQRVAWTIGGDKFPIYEAGIANLTKDAAPMLVHLEDGTSNQMTLIRLPDPGAGAAAATGQGN